MISQLYFDVELYMFWTGLLYSIRSLDTVFRASTPLALSPL